MSYPKLIVFDLDYTLWPFWCDTHISPPVRATKDGTTVKDKGGDTFAFYKDVPEILRELRDRDDVKVCVASRTHAPRVAKDLLAKLLIDGEPAHNFFDDYAWGVGSKVGHIRELNKSTNWDFKQMILYDDESRNHDVERELGVTFAEVRRGLDRNTFNKGIELWRKNNKKRE